MNPAPYSLRELVWMANGKMSHHWDLFVPLICHVANPWLKKRDQLSPEKIHPFRRAEASKPKPFNRENWKLLKSRIKGNRK